MTISSKREAILVRRQVPLWQWVVIGIGLLIILIGAGRWVYSRFSASKVPPPPASPQEAVKEYQEMIWGTPGQTPKR